MSINFAEDLGNGAPDLYIACNFVILLNLMNKLVYLWMDGYSVRFAQAGCANCPKGEFMLLAFRWFSLISGGGSHEGRPDRID